MNALFSALFLTLAFQLSQQFIPIDNALAPPEVVYRADPQQFEPRCKIHGKPLDLLFVMDSSGSLKNRFEEELDVMKRIVETVAISQDATRVSLVQYSGIARTEFHFNTFYRRTQVLQAIDTLRSIAGITRTGTALEWSRQEFTPANGMRGREVPKLVFLLSDGRTHDYPEDKVQADALKADFGVNIWAYGTGDYVALNELINITGDPSKIITNKNLDQLEPLFEEFKGVEICEEVPVCIPGSDKPLDLMFVVDASNSVEGKFREEINFLRRVLHNVNIHPDAVRVALITYSAHPYLNFDFNRYQNSHELEQHVDRLLALNGTTAAREALQLAFRTFDIGHGMRNASVPKMAIVLTDGFHQTNPVAFARRLVRQKNVIVAAVAPMRQHDVLELLGLTDGHRERVFTPQNMDEWENWFLQYVSLTCPGTEVSMEDGIPEIRGATSQRCTENSITVTVRTRKPFEGFLYVYGHYGDPGCIIRGDGTTETSMTIIDGQCGLQRTPVPGRGYQFNTSVTIQYHTEVLTGYDQTIDFSCFAQASVPQDLLPQASLKSPLEAKCLYTMRKQNYFGCVALDARVGDILVHKWECDHPPNYGMLVHDCIAVTDQDTLPLLDSNGCEIDPHILQTPRYDKSGQFAFREMGVFKFPGNNYAVRFHCQISLCDREAANSCKSQLIPNCNARTRRAQSLGPRPILPSRNLAPATKRGFDATFNVHTRSLNVLESENLRPQEKLKYCFL